MSGESSLPARDETSIASLPLLDHQEVDWSRVERTAFLLHQQLRYTYPGPIEDLRQRLMIFPPAVHGDQRRVMYRLQASTEIEETRTHCDGFGNTVLDLFVPRVEDAIDFEAWIVVERSLRHGPHVLPSAALADQRLLLPSPLSGPGPLLEKAAHELAAPGGESLALAERINNWVYQTMTYAHDVTDIHTTAEEALALGQGVCQDYAHIMTALCRLCGIPARYVSGHLLGEGGTHAWVEVLVPAKTAGEVTAWPFDPTHGRRAGMSYLTIAVGRDYADVAPTSGTFRARYRGLLSTYKRVGLTSVDYLPSTPPSEGAA